MMDSQYCLKFLTKIRGQIEILVWNRDEITFILCFPDVHKSVRKMTTVKSILSHERSEEGRLVIKQSADIYEQDVLPCTGGLCSRIIEEQYT